MSIHAALKHETLYDYDRRVGLSPQIIRLRPAPHSRTPVLSYSLKIEPQPHFLNWQQDPFGNWQARVVFPEAVKHFHVTVDLVADISVYNPFDFFVEPDAEKFPFAYEKTLAEELKPYFRRDEAGPLLAKLLDSLPRAADNTVNFLVDLNQRLQREIRYLIRMEPGVQTPEETLRNASGSCRDTGWLLVQLLRHLGLASRFVSGYLIQLKPDVKSLDGPSGTDYDFTDLHAWCEVFIPGAGWIGLDPTSGLLAGEGHIPLCATPEPQSAAPITGAVDKCEVTFAHHMKVTRIFETPRVTYPYSDDEWKLVDKLGEKIDAQLGASDMRLTMGGEPTFVSIDDFQSDEWNTAAVGPTKQQLALRLIQRLRDRFAPKGLITYGQGKWYPGESLPRWAYSLYWRGDGKPLWNLGAPQPSREPITTTVAQRFLCGIAERLAIDPDYVLPAYEDPFHYLHKERQLPYNVTPLDSKLKDVEERARLSAVFERGLDAPKGFVLPIQRWQARAWISERWTTRQGKLFLIPGDSPVGLRLPLESLPWVPGVSYPHVFEQDPSLQSRELPQQSQLERPAHMARPATIPAAVRTAMAVEVREGFVNVFLPPVSSTEDYLELVAAIEDVARETRAPVRIEGYAPPQDLRVNLIKVTPDPGVIEVNIHPARSWSDLRDNTNALYEEARQSRLGTEKFLIDGRSVGTGGGNHVVVGGIVPGDSPFLRRPDLLGSLIRYWQNHPSLSYLFSGLFIGPTSQHPRVDEARDTQLYELEIALSQLPVKGAPNVQPWLVDRVLRHLMTDLTGNTHRSELCIDKLFSPDSATGRLGLVEFRCFEMPPHARMSLAQQLVLRAMLAWFWEQPYTRKLVNFGTQLHDRYMLPHFVWQDFCEVLDDLRSAGYAFKREWFGSHFEFRFPRHGAINFQGTELELRHALEPWPVLGEEPGAGGTARFVDSSLERVQLTARHLNGKRYLVACNGRRLPLASTGTEGEFVAGVRFRAWQPASCLHPTIGVHTPLWFDLYDTWNQRAVAGFTYHVAHPAGRNYETFPVNAYEAESRRLSRFEPRGHTPGYYSPPEERPNMDFPLTLDLRRLAG
ncbi:MAG TPA: transglutaminase family protein [Nevskiaceae bacterium]|nr:transglutaminase family protein [Nevskiaceae bacterium]